MLEKEKGTSVHHFSHRKIAVVALMLVVLTSVEVYAHTYVQISSLSLVTEDEVHTFANYTGTYTFSRSGCRWLVGWIRTAPQFGYVDIFKIEQNGSLFVLRTDLLILGLEAPLNSMGRPAANLSETYYASNYTDLRITYDNSNQTGFDLHVRVYEETLIGLIPQEDVTIPINATVFNGSSPPDQTGNLPGCPILYTYDGKDYQCEGLLNIHNAAGIDVTAEHTLTKWPGRVNDLYEFKLVEHPQTISHIDQVELCAVLQDGKVVDLPLVWAWHSEYGNVLPQLLFDDEWKVVELGANHNNGVSQSIQLEFLALPPNVKVQAFMFRIEGVNPIPKD
jgi:hypothetical protein